MSSTNYVKDVVQARLDYLIGHLSALAKEEKKLDDLRRQTMKDHQAQLKAMAAEYNKAKKALTAKRKAKEAEIDARLNEIEAAQIEANFEKGRAKKAVKIL